MSWPGLIPAIHILLVASRSRPVMPATSAGMTRRVCYFSQIFSGIGMRAGQFIVPE